MAVRRTYLAIAAAMAVITPPGSALAGGEERPATAVGTADPARQRAAQEGRAERRGFLRSELECTVRAGTRLVTGVGLDCDSRWPNNEPDVVVDPADPLHAVVSSNDYDSCCGQFYTTFDGGLTWRTGNMAALGRGRLASDPVTAIDPRHGTVVHASLSYTPTVGGGSGDGHIVASVSRDGGVVWDRPVVVAEGYGDERDRDQIFHDKPWIVTDTTASSPYYGRTYLAWARFRLRYGSYVESPIWLASSDDGGFTWSEPKEISGSAARLCSAPVNGRSGRCANDHAPVPTVGPDGALTVAFLNNQNEAIWEAGDPDDQYLVVGSDDGGATFTPPVHVVGLENGDRDYPENAKGKPTLTGVQARLPFPPGGNIVADPRTGALVLVFSDNRAGTARLTDTNVYLMTSDDGRRWTGPAAVATGPGDQWFPWADVNPRTGAVGVVYNDGNIGGDGLYGLSLAEGRPGAMRTRSLAPARSDLRDSLFFQADVAGCRRCTTFVGDYINLAYGSDGRAWVGWTDMRRVIEFRGDTGHRQEIRVARL